VRRSFTVANGTEVMADKVTASACVSLIEECVHFHMHDSASKRHFPSANVVSLPRFNTGFNFLDVSSDGTAFVVRVGRVSGLKIHVYAVADSSSLRVVVLGSEHSVMITVETLKAALLQVATGKDHSAARDWVITTLTDMFQAGGDADKHGVTPSPPSLPVAVTSASVRAETGAEHETQSPVAANRSPAPHHADVSQPSPLMMHAATLLPPQPQPPLFSLPPLPPLVPHTTLRQIPPADAQSLFACRWCCRQPRRVAFSPCSHLVLCTACADVHMKSRAPCIICGAPVIQRLTFYLE
jgi:hypothetical protein